MARPSQKARNYEKSLKKEGLCGDVQFRQHQKLSQFTEAGFSDLEKEYSLIITNMAESLRDKKRLSPALKRIGEQKILDKIAEMTVQTNLSATLDFKSGYVHFFENRPNPLAVAFNGLSLPDHKEAPSVPTAALLLRPTF